MPSAELVRRGWETGPNADAIKKIAEGIALLSNQELQLFRVALELEVGNLPWIGECGFTWFEQEENDHRIISPGEDHEQGIGIEAAGTARPRATASSAGASPGRAAAGTAEADPRPAPRRGYASVAEVIAEDSGPLARYFPQFSVPFWEPQLRWWCREGWLQPYGWLPARFGVRLCYDEEPLALPLVRIAPDPHPKAPHLWLHARGQHRFRSLCYTFAPDGTWVRGRSSNDNAAEVLRQAVVWLCRYLVWLRFQFWPGEDVGHDPAVIERFTKPSDPCPAHPYRTYASCCRPRILAALARRSAALR